MKIRWKEHEMILFTALAVTLAGGLAWSSLGQENINLYHSDASFNSHHVVFNLYRNLLLPGIGLTLLIYFSYLFFNHYITKPLLSVTKSVDQTGSRKKIYRILSWFLILFVLPGSGMFVVIYYRNEWEGWSFRNMLQAYLVTFTVLVVFTAYSALRETIIYFIEHSVRKKYWTLVCNKVTGFLVISIIIPFFSTAFHLVHERSLVDIYFSLVIPVFLIYMVNTYWIFPVKGNSPFFRIPVLLRLLLSTFICTIPFVWFFPIHEGFSLVFLIGWVVQLLVITPVTWLLFQIRKDKILQLRGIETELVKSTTDLRFLRSQINPHFLFNTLNTIYGSALKENAECTAESIQQLGDMMRFMLEENTKDLISLKQEIKYLENYISLQKTRIGFDPAIPIEVQINVPGSGNYKIAPMLFIPFVENAFKHGVRLDERSWIKISLNGSGAGIVFDIRNSLHIKQNNNSEDERTGIGNKNVIDRLKMLYPGKHHISFSTTHNEYIVNLALIQLTDQ